MKLLKGASWVQWLVRRCDVGATYSNRCTKNDVKPTRRQSARTVAHRRSIADEASVAVLAGGARCGWCGGAWALQRCSRCERPRKAVRPFRIIIADGGAAEEGRG